MFTTIRRKLLVILLLFVVTTIVMSVVVFNYFEKNKRSITSITQNAESTHVTLLQDIKLTHEFFENETINPEFFRTGRSELIIQHNIICSKIDVALNDLYQLQEQKGFNLNDSINNLKKDFEKYKSLTAETFKQILQRGFKDYGTEGLMRQYAHNLEKYSKQIGLVNILQLRRHEKDFIIRQEEPYIKKNNELISSIKDELAVNQNVSTSDKKSIIDDLNNYSKEFNKLTGYERRLGLKSHSGLKKEIDDISNKIETSLAMLVSFSAKQGELALSNISMIYMSIGLMFILIAIVSALLISKKVSASITILKTKIEEFVQSDFTVRTVLPINNSQYEIDVLTTNFSIMEQHIVNQMSSLKHSNKDLEMLFYAASHDIRRPLIEVKEITNSAFIKTTDPETKKQLSQINRAWENLINTVDELGIITNVRSEEIRPELLDLEDLVHDIYNEFRAYPRFDEVIFSLEIKTKKKFSSSPGHMRSIFRHLIENSIKYSMKRSGFSFLKILIVDQNEDTLRIEVADNGIGIKKQYQECVFDMFFRGTNSANGTGLGLYIVKCAVEKLHGAIGLESDENSGTTFTLILPNSYNKKNLKEKILHNKEISELTSVTMN